MSGIKSKCSALVAQQVYRQIQVFLYFVAHVQTSSKVNISKEKWSALSNSEVEGLLVGGMACYGICGKSHTYVRSFSPSFCPWLSSIWIVIPWVLPSHRTTTFHSGMTCTSLIVQKHWRFELWVLQSASTFPNSITADSIVGTVPCQAVLIVTSWASSSEPQSRLWHTKLHWTGSIACKSGFLMNFKT